jgi:hypothetical protein
MTRYLQLDSGQPPSSTTRPNHTHTSNCVSKSLNSGTTAQEAAVRCSDNLPQAAAPSMEQSVPLRDVS